MSSRQKSRPKVATAHSQTVSVHAIRHQYTEITALGMIVLLIIGKRASGKTTIAKIIEKDCGFKHLEMSVLLKEMRMVYKKENLRLRSFAEYLRMNNTKTLAIKNLMDKSNQKEKVVITGIRHLDELIYLKSEYHSIKVISFYIKLNIFQRLIRAISRVNRNSILEFFIEEYYSIKWGNQKLLKHCDFYIKNSSSAKSIETIKSKISCQ